MKDRIVRFLNELDTALIPIADGRQLQLYHVGRSALVWKYGFASATEDVDVILPGHNHPLLEEAMRQFGRSKPKAVEHGLYLDQVPEGLPPVPGGFDKRAVEVEERWTVIRLFHLEPNDLAATKLKGFRAKDREDIRMMCDFELLDPDLLQLRLESAFRYTLLSRYALQSPAESFAEMHREIVEKGAESVKMKWPKCVKYFESKGLL